MLWSRLNPFSKVSFACACLGVLLALHSVAFAQDDSSKTSNNAAGNADVEKVIQNFVGKGQITDDSKPTPPAESLKMFELPEGLKIEQLATEPDIAQPLYMWFDERERLWLLEYRQYPFPAGLKVLRYDQYLRAVFDNVPQPPPNHVPGLDKVTVFEDVDGDGKFDSRKDVITGLNIATSVVTGRKGIWVMNPPYLLFYPDADGDDIPDGPPVVKLSGFGIQDTHSTANSMAWGPDGWLYGANGSTTTADVISKASKVSFEGQCIWRFHPETEVFEVYAEGGGNTYSLEFDARGRVFSGTNHGNTRGMYYPQGSYGEKNFGKHGPLTNPYAFGYFKHMDHEGDTVRFAQTFVIYDGDTLPKKYQGNIIAANSLHNRVWASELSRNGSTYRTVDIPVLCSTKDHWFRPVDVKVGPDGGVYLADWYDSRLSHVDPKDTWHKESGRLYRIQSTDAPKHTPTNFKKLTNQELIERFKHTNKWQRHTAARVLGERLLDAGSTPEAEATRKQLRNLCLADSPDALEALWALHLGAGFNEELAAQLLTHPQVDVRRWTVRLLGDHRNVSTSMGSNLARMAHSEPDVQVRSQLASSARRMETSIALPILEGLLTHAEDAQDPHMPLMLWWLLESHCGNVVENGAPHLGMILKPAEAKAPREQVLQWFAEPQRWSNPVVQETLVPRLMRRLTQEMATKPVDQQDWSACDRLLQLVPSSEVKQQLVAAFLEGSQGQKLATLPQPLNTAINEYQAELAKSDVVAGIRIGNADAIKKGLEQLRNNNTPIPLRLKLIEICGETKLPGALQPLLGLLGSPSAALKRASLQALVSYNDASIPNRICSAWQSTLTDEDGIRIAALRTLASRPEWTARLLNEITEFRIAPSAVPADIIQQMRLHSDPELQKQVDKIWGRVRETSAEKQEQIARLKKLIQGHQFKEGGQKPDIAVGKALYKEHCATCHKLFGEGGELGPNLTGYERSNLDFMLQSMVDPSAGIREEFTQFQVVTEDGRVLTGLLTDQTPLAITIKSADNKTTVLPRDEVEILQGMQTSLMPEGLLQRLSDEQVIALMQYLTAPAPQ